MFSEHSDCVLFSKILKSKNILFSKIANETRTSSFRQKQKNKSEGLSRGVPDYIIVLRKRDGTKVLCFVEMKREKGGQISIFQKQRIQNLQECGIHARVCKGVQEALSFITQIQNDY